MPHPSPLTAHPSPLLSPPPPPPSPLTPRPSRLTLHPLLSCLTPHPSCLAAHPHSSRLVSTLDADVVGPGVSPVISDMGSSESIGPVHRHPKCNRQQLVGGPPPHPERHLWTQLHQHHRVQCQVSILAKPPDAVRTLQLNNVTDFDDNALKAHTYGCLSESAFVPLW